MAFNRANFLRWSVLLILSGGFVVGSSLEAHSQATRPRFEPTLSSGDEYARVKLFGIEATGNKFVYVFDRSGSMDGAPLAAAKRELLKSLGSLQDLNQFEIIFFNHRLLSFDSAAGAGRIAFATDRNKQLAADFVAGVKADGGTNRFLALKQALALRPDTIFFLTDAADPMPDRELSQITRLNERNGGAICVIEFGHGEEPKESFLRTLANQTGGQYRYVDTRQLSQ